MQTMCYVSNDPEHSHVLLTILVYSRDPSWWSALTEDTSSFIDFGDNRSPMSLRKLKWKDPLIRMSYIELFVCLLKDHRALIFKFSIELVVSFKTQKEKKNITIRKHHWKIMKIFCFFYFCVTEIEKKLSFLLHFHWKCNWLTGCYITPRAFHAWEIASLTDHVINEHF